MTELRRRGPSKRSLRATTRVPEGRAEAEVARRLLAVSQQAPGAGAVRAGRVLETITPSERRMKPGHSALALNTLTCSCGRAV
jgi:hypothetical protein